MALEPCEVCNCVPGEIPNDTFKQNVIVVLCALLTAIEEGGGGGGCCTPTTLNSGQTNVATAGTQVVLGPATTIKSVTVKAKHTNTGLIFVGASTVDSATGFILSAGDSVSVDIDDLSDVWIDSSVNGEGVSYIYVN